MNARRWFLNYCDSILYINVHVQIQRRVIRPLLIEFVALGFAMYLAAIYDMIQMFKFILGYVWTSSNNRFQACSKHQEDSETSMTISFFWKKKKVHSGESEEIVYNPETKAQLAFLNREVLCVITTPEISLPIIE